MLKNIILAALLGHISAQTIGKQVACPKPIVEQVMFFDDDKCTKPSAG